MMGVVKRRVTDAREGTEEGTVPAFITVHFERQIHLACTLSQYQNRIKSVSGTKESLSCERRTGITRDFCLAVVFTLALFGL